MRTLVLAGGKQRRWYENGGEGRKQFIPVRGVPIIHRTFRQAASFCPDVVTVVEDPSDPCWKGLNPEPAQHEEWMGEMGKFLDARHLWPEGEDITILWGDAYYTDDLIRTIYETEIDQPTVFGRAHASGRRAESFAFRFRPEDRDEVVRYAMECADAGLNRRGGPWRWFLRRHTGADGYSLDRVRPLAVRENGWVEVTPDASDDFDRPEHLAEWRKAFRLPAE